MGTKATKQENQKVEERIFIFHKEYAVKRKGRGKKKRFANETAIKNS